MFDTAWDCQIDDAVTTLRQDQIEDYQYWFDTVATVEAGYDPATYKPITLPALDAWVSRCKSNPYPKEATSHASLSRRRVTPNRDVRHELLPNVWTDFRVI